MATTLPNTTLSKIYELQDQVIASGGTDALASVELAQAFRNLDVWMRSGGFKPGPWCGGHAAPERTPEHYLR